MKKSVIALKPNFILNKNHKKIANIYVSEFFLNKYSFNITPYNEFLNKNNEYLSNRASRNDMLRRKMEIQKLINEIMNHE